jgi:resuscitation-promoting factor RpfB
LLRSAKYGLYGAVLAGVVAGTVAFTAGPAAKSVRLVVDGKAQTVHTEGSDVGQVLADAGYKLDGHDLVAPAPSTSVTNGSTIVLKRGRLLHLSVDGQTRDVWTTAPTVAAAMSDLGYSQQDLTSVSRAHRLPLSATDIDIRLPKFVVVYHDGARTALRTTDTTLRQAFRDMHLKLGRYDRISEPLSTSITRRTVVRIHRIEHSVLTKRESIPFRTRSVDDSKLLSGHSRVVVAGRDGVRELRWAAVYVDGKLAGKTKLPSRVLRRPVVEVRHDGTKQPPIPTSGPPQQIARAMMAKDYGWGSDQLSCLVQMWDRESGWTTTATNPSTGAYGIPQALPGSKMASAGADWQTSAATQIKWGLGYIASRYGTPCGAWALWQSQGWY